MLLSRVADALYWISRYLERAEHIARVIDVAVDLGLGQLPHGDDTGIGRLDASLGLQNRVDQGKVPDATLFDLANRNSVMACITAARENARQVREEISSDMWEQLNSLFLRVRQMRGDSAWTARTHFVSRTVIDGIHLLQGLTDATMGHGEGWQYLQVGRFLERAASTSTLLVSFLVDTDRPPGLPAALAQGDCVALLRSCAALEAYRRVYTADVRAELVAEFILLNAEFPRSVRFAANQVETALLALARYSGRRAGGRVERLAGRLHSSLDYGQVDEILSDNPHEYLSGISQQCALIHAALHQTYITYSIETALPA